MVEAIANHELIRDGETYVLDVHWHRATRGLVEQCDGAKRPWVASAHVPMQPGQRTARVHNVLDDQNITPIHRHLEVMPNTDGSS